MAAKRSSVVLGRLGTAIISLPSPWLGLCSKKLVAASASITSAKIRG